MIAIIGAGISGLTLAYELQKAGKPYILFESSSRPGGYIKSVQQGSYLLEVGPNSILVDKNFENFLSGLTLTDKIEDAAIVNKNRFIYKNNRIQKVPSGPLALFFSSFFSFKTKVSVLKEAFNKTKTYPTESVYDFFTRRFTSELTQYTVDPFATGVYAGDIKKLNMAETFPQVVAFEKEFGSVLKGVFKKGFGERRRTASINGGLQTITDTLASKLQHIQYNSKVLSLREHVNGYMLDVQKNDQIVEAYTVSKVVFCGTAFHSAEILKEEFPGVAKKLSDVNYAPVKAFYAAFKRADVEHKMQGFGCLYPSIEKSFLAGTIWNSSIFKNRCPEDEILTTSFIGGMHHPEYTHLSDAELIQRATKQVTRDLDIKGDPTFTYVAGWDKAIPQYDLSLKEARVTIEECASKQIYFTSNWTQAISLGTCVQNAQLLAKIV